MAQRSIPCVFMRGGTSKALVFHQRDLPSERSAWNAIFLSAMGTPDPYGRQLDGMGGGISSLSKVCVVGPPTRDDADVDFTFAQLGVDTAIVDYAGNCGNMSSAIGPFAVDEGLVPAQKGDTATIRIHNTNTGKIVQSTFPVAQGRAVFEGDFAIDGVAGHGAKVQLDFVDPEGAKTGKALPTGKAIDRLNVDGFGTIEASLVDVTNPSVFIRARDLDLTGMELPEAVERDPKLLVLLERIRTLASVKMGMTRDLAEASLKASQPKIAFLAPPSDGTTIAGKRYTKETHDIQCRMISMGRPHRAVPLTGALCLAAACCIPGTIANQIMGSNDALPEITIAHPSGTTLVGAKTAVNGNAVRVEQATIYRTTRRLFEGRVFYRDDTVA